MWNCNTCQKPFERETAWKRHIRYCGTRQRVRPRACLNCSIAKAKCTFEKQCVRCSRRGIQCEYGEGSNFEPSLSTNVSDPTVVSIDDNSGDENAEFITNDLVAFGAYQLTSCHNQQPSWCSWLRPGFSTSYIFDEPNIISALRADIKNQSADIVIKALRSYPIMMLRRETFPSFIHRQSVSSTALTTCMGISQMFSMRTPETRRLIWNSIRMEHDRFVAEMFQSTKSDLTAALQACMIYLIMFLIDQEDNDKEAMALLLALQSLTMHWKTVDRLEVKADTKTWDGWILHESQVRLTILWLLIGCVVCVKTGVEFDSTASYRDIEMPCSKYLWESQSAGTWAEESRPMISSCRLRTLGDLIGEQRNEGSEDLDRWNAGVDGLTSLLNLVHTMVK